MIDIDLRQIKPGENENDFRQIKPGENTEKNWHVFYGYYDIKFALMAPPANPG